MEKLYQNRKNPNIYYKCDVSKENDIEHVTCINVEKGTLESIDFNQRNDHFIDYFKSNEIDKDIWNGALKTIILAHMVG